MFSFVSINTICCTIKNLFAIRNTYLLYTSIINYILLVVIQYIVNEVLQIVVTATGYHPGSFTTTIVIVI